MKSEAFLKACLLLASLALLPGCGTLIGLGVGAMVDADGPSAGDYAGEEIERLEEPASLRVTLIDGTDVRGQFAGFRDYDLEYGRLAAAGSVPPIGSRVAVDFQDVTLQRTEGRLVFLDDRGPVLGFTVADPFGRSLRRIPLDQVVAVRSREGSEWTGASLAASQPPRRDRIAVDVGDETRSIPLDAVRSVEVRGRKGGRIAFGLLGLGVDTVTFLWWLEHQAMNWTVRGGWFGD